MLNFYDIAYGIGVTLASPVWGMRSASREKVLRAFGMRMGHVPPRDGDGPAILIHAVSLGEINATSQLVKQLHIARPDLHVVVSTTTVTGYDRGRQLYGRGKPGVSLVRFPLDFTTAINHFLEAIRPSAVVLMEGEIWPNFLLRCQQRAIPVLLVNGRITLPAFRRYQWIGPVTRQMLQRIAILCAQDEIYADRFRKLGTPPERIKITGTMKFDTARFESDIAHDQQLAADLNLDRFKGPIWVCGSTGPGEEALLLDCYRVLLRQFTALRLVIVPRKPERFDEVATLIAANGFHVLRRSQPRPFVVDERPVILGDTMGELRKFYSLADVVFVGRTLLDLGPRQHGSDMIEPAALGKPVAVGPWTGNFAEAIHLFLKVNAMREVSTVSELAATIGEWLANPAGATETGTLAQRVVRQNQGATARHAAEILQAIAAPRYIS